MSSIALSGNAAGAGVFTIAAPNSASSYTLTLPAVTATLLSSASALVSTSSGTLGYSTGAGGSVTQATSKTTGVTLNTATGNITMNAAALAANTTVGFTLTNSIITVSDNVIVTNAGGNGGSPNYQVWVYIVQSGSCLIAVRNITSGSLSEAVVINFAVIKGASA